MAAAVIGSIPYAADWANNPAQDAFAITPSDSINFGAMSRFIYVGTAGDVAAVTAQGTVVIFASVPKGTVLPLMAVRINATNTTASQLVGMV
jgi:hypothetical protein